MRVSKLWTLTAIVISATIVTYYLTEWISMETARIRRLEARHSQPIASENEDLLQRMKVLPCRVIYSGVKYEYCYREIDIMAKTLPDRGGPWTLDRLIEEHFKHHGSCVKQKTQPMSEQSLLNSELFSEKRGECRDIIKGRLMLIASSYRPEAGWFLGNELNRQTLAGAAAAAAIAAYYSEFSSCCENALFCPSSAGSSECFENFPAFEWWKAHHGELAHHEIWRQRLLKNVGLTAQQYHFN